MASPKRPNKCADASAVGKGATKRSNKAGEKGAGAPKSATKAISATKGKRGSIAKVSAQAVNRAVAELAAEEEIRSPSPLAKTELTIIPSATNFTEDEDIFLCKAYINSTSDLVVGANLKGDKFWKKVHKRMYELYDDQAEVVIQGKREWDSIRNRFQKKIAKEVRVFSLYYRQVAEAQKSGYNDKEKILEAALNLYQDMHGRDFKFAFLLEILYQSNKFDPMLADIQTKRKKTDDGTERTSTLADSTKPSIPGCNNAAPIGNKREKREQLQAKLMGNTTAQSRASDVNNQAIKEWAASNRLSVIVKSQAVELSALIKLGRHEEAYKVIEQMRIDREKLEKRPEIVIPEPLTLPSVFQPENPSPLTLTASSVAIGGQAVDRLDDGDEGSSDSDSIDRDLRDSGLNLTNLKNGDTDEDDEEGGGNKESEEMNKEDEDVVNIEAV